MNSLSGLAGMALLALASAILISRDARATAGFYGLAAIPQAVIAGGLGVVHRQAELLVLAGVLLFVKGYLAPRLLTRVWPPSERSAYRLSGPTGTAGAMVAALAAAAVALRVGSVVAPDGATIGISGALAAMFVGMLAPALRHELFTQAGGLLIAEAGASAAALLLVGALPGVADAVSLADLMFLAIAFGVLLRWVATVHGRADARLLGGHE